MKIKKMYLESSIIFMNNIKLQRSDSRKRSAFVKRLVKEYDQFKVDREEIMKAFIPKDKKGKLIWKADKDGKPQNGIFDPTDPEKMNEEISELIQEEVIIERTKENAAVYDIVDQILQDYDGDLSDKDAVTYDVLCGAFESEELVF